MLKVGDYSRENRVYQCSKCGNLSALLDGEKAKACDVCDGMTQQWKPTRKEFILRSRNVAREIEHKKNWVDRLSDKITAWCGSMSFVVVHIVWFGWWLTYNELTLTPFDPFPYGLLTLIVSLEAIFLATFILISQNRQAEISELRAELDYQVDSKAEKHIEEILALTRSLHRKKR